MSLELLVSSKTKEPPGCTKELQPLGGTDDALNAVVYRHVQEADHTCL